MDAVLAVDRADLHDLFGPTSTKAYANARRIGAAAELRSSSRRCRAADLWRQMLTMLFGNHASRITFRD